MMGQKPNQTMDRMRGSAVRLSPQSSIMGALPLIGHLLRFAGPRRCGLTLS